MRLSVGWVENKPFIALALTSQWRIPSLPHIIHDLRLMWICEMTIWIANFMCNTVKSKKEKSKGIHFYLPIQSWGSLFNFSGTKLSGSFRDRATRVGPNRPWQLPWRYSETPRKALGVSPTEPRKIPEASRNQKDRGKFPEASFCVKTVVFWGMSNEYLWIDLQDLDMKMNLEPWILTCDVISQTLQKTWKTG